MLYAAARVWWMLRSFGHNRVAILDGGLRAWREAGQPVATEVPPPGQGTFTARLDPAVLRDRSDVLANIDSRAEQVVDARLSEHFEGLSGLPVPGHRAGHVPGARSVPIFDLSDPATGRLLPDEALRSRFAEAGVDMAAPVVASCGSGITACGLVLALHLLGKATSRSTTAHGSNGAGRGAVPLSRGQRPDDRRTGPRSTRACDERQPRPA